MRNHKFSLRAMSIVLAVPLALILTTVVALANSGSVTQSSSCEGGQVVVHLDGNVSLDKRIDVVTSIPGTTGIVNGHYNTDAGNGGTGPVDIVIYSGPQPFAGSVSLSIRYSNGQYEHPPTATGYHTTIAAVEPCSEESIPEQSIPEESIPPSETPSETPSPTETPSETPVATPVVTPSETPTATIPNTAMHLASLPEGTNPALLFVGIMLIGLALMILASVAFRWKS